MSRPLGRLRPNVVHTNIVSNQSSRHGVQPRLITIHSTEGSNIPRSSRDLIGLGGHFDLPATDASSHVATDGDGNSARYVRDARKAWTQAFYNPVSLSIEMIGKAFSENWTDANYDEAARWVAEWSLEHGIPIRRGIVLNGAVVRSGVISHKALGALGGGHLDPGPRFSMRRLRRRAKLYRNARLENRDG